MYKAFLLPFCKLKFPQEVRGNLSGQVHAVLASAAACQPIWAWMGKDHSKKTSSSGPKEVGTVPEQWQGAAGVGSEVAANRGVSDLGRKLPQVTLGEPPQQANAVILELLLRVGISLDPLTDGPAEISQAGILQQS